MCELYLKKVSHNELQISGSSGKIFPWAMPPVEVERSIYEHMWEDVRGKVWRALDNLEVLVTERRQSGSDSGSEDNQASCDFDKW
jgi:DNA-binding IclR family transcriptional regulator